MGETLERIHRALVGEEDAGVREGIAPGARDHVPRNFVLQLVARLASKIGDALSSPRLVLPWLLEGAGVAPAYLGALVPIRESGSLLPQLVLGGWMGGFALRKPFWIAGAFGQAVSVAAIALCALRLRGDILGALSIGFLVVFALARSLASIASKDLLGKTIPRTQRGRLIGWSASAAGAISLATGLVLGAVGLGRSGDELLLVIILVAALAWLLGSVAMAALREMPSETRNAGRGWKRGGRGLTLIAQDADLRRFCIARGLMAGTVLAMPFLALMAKDATGGRIETLGLLLVATSGAQMSSGWVWGHLSDRSSRRTLALAAFAASAILLLAAICEGLALDGGMALVVYFGLFFLLGLAHTGIRTARKTYIVDLAPAEDRAAYVAVANTFIGLILLASSVLGLVAAWLSPRELVFALGLLALAGAAVTLRLRELGPAEA